MTARTFRCRECGYPFKTADEGWARDAALMCPACGSSDVNILTLVPSSTRTTMRATESTGARSRVAASGRR
jgi:DNA-directed RNA polymerase subunit RPC12/RpoP